MTDTEINLDDSDGSDIEFTREERLEFARRKFEQLKKKRLAKDSKKNASDVTVASTTEPTPLMGNTTGENTLIDIQPDPIYHPSVISSQSTTIDYNPSPVPPEITPIPQVPVVELSPEITAGSQPILSETTSSSYPQVHSFDPTPTSEVGHTHESQPSNHYEPAPVAVSTMASETIPVQTSTDKYDAIPSTSEPVPHVSKITPAPQASSHKYDPPVTAQITTSEPITEPITEPSVSIQKYEPLTTTEQTTTSKITPIPGSFFSAYEPEVTSVPPTKTTEEPTRSTSDNPFQQEIEQLKKTIESQKNTINKLRDENTDLKLSQMDLKDKISKLELENKSLQGSTLTASPVMTAKPTSRVYSPEMITPAKPTITRNDYASVSQQSFSKFPQTENFRDKLMIWEGWQVDMTNWPTGSSQKVEI